MTDVKMLPNYYKETELSHFYPLKHSFQKIIFEKIQQAVTNHSTISQEQFDLDKVFLFEAKTFLRLSIFNLLAYKHLVCGKYLPSSLVILYYSYFYSISCLLRLAGKAAIHYKELPEQIFEISPKKKTRSIRFQLTRKNNSHDYVMAMLGGSEHLFVWDTFSKYFPDLSRKDIGRLFIEDRMRWNYDLFYPSHATEDFVLQETTDRCNYNFIDRNLGQNFESGAAEDLHNKISQFGYEEVYAGDLIRKCLEIFCEVAKKSKHRSQYIDYFEKIENEIDLLESNKSTKDEIKTWFASAIQELKQSSS